jgi:FkbM family methyltransferase
MASLLVGLMQRAVPWRLRPLLVRVPYASRVASALLGSREEVVLVHGGPLGGKRLQVRVGSEKAYWSGVYEPEVQQIIEGLQLDDAVAWDVGAHVGFFSLLLASRCRRVVALEPSPENARRLRANVELNDAPVDVREVAVSGRVGTAFLDGSAEMSHLASSGIVVETITLDALLAEAGPPDFVKMDVEGAELDALRAAPELLAHRPTILVEVHGPEQRDGVHELLSDAGFSVEATSAWRLLAR